MCNYDITLRPVIKEDSKMLLLWRNDPLTRKQSHDTNIVTKAKHVAWLKAVLSSSDRKLYIAEHNNIPIGTVRADSQNDFYMLSWTVAPDARSKGFGKHMVKAFIQQLDKPVKAEIRKDNTASIKIAKYVGLSFVRQKDDIYFYES